MTATAPAPVHTRRPGRLARLGRADRVLAALVGVHVVLKLLLLPFVGDAEVVGDERYYLDAGRELSNLVRDLVALGPVDTAGLERNVVGNGWFMPGMGLVTAPLFLVVPDASMGLVRGYLGVVSTGLLLLTAASVRRTLGAPYAAALMVFPGLVPIWLLFSYAAWGDLMAGLVIVLMVTALVRWHRAAGDGTGPSRTDGVRLGLLAIAVVYLRSSAILVSSGLLVAALGAALLLLRRTARRRGVGSLAVAGGVFAALLLPWSLAASASLGTWVTTTTSVPNVLANTFGDRDQVCYGPCDSDSSKWFGPVRYSREVARETGVSELEVQEEMSDYARQDVSPTGYADDVIANLDMYAGDPGRFAELIRAPGIGDDWRTTAIERTSESMFWTGLALAVIAFATIVRRRLEDQLLGIGLKLAIGALLTQPFVHVCGSRYWPTSGPLWALAVVLAWQARTAVPRADGTSVLVRIQWLLVAAAGVTAAAVWLLSRA